MQVSPCDLAMFVPGPVHSADRTTEDASVHWDERAQDCLILRVLRCLRGDSQELHYSGHCPAYCARSARARARRAVLRPQFAPRQFVLAARSVRISAWARNPHASFACTAGSATAAKPATDAGTASALKVHARYSASNGCPTPAAARVQVGARDQRIRVDQVERNHQRQARDQRAEGKPPPARVVACRLTARAARSPPATPARSPARP